MILSSKSMSSTSGLYSVPIEMTLGFPTDTMLPSLSTLGAIPLSVNVTFPGVSFTLGT